MQDPESTASNESMVERGRDVYGGWLRLFTEGLAFQTNLVRGLAEASVESGRTLHRQYADLLAAWMGAAAGAGRPRTPPSSGRQTASPSDDRMQSAVDAPRTAAGEASAEAPSRQPPVERPHETSPGHEGEPVAAGAGTGGASEQSTDRAQPAPGPGAAPPGPEPAPPDPESAETDTAADVDQLETLEPEDAEQLRSADVHTVGQLATATPEELAAETGLDPRRLRVWIVRARRARRW